MIVSPHLVGVFLAGLSYLAAAGPHWPGSAALAQATMSRPVVQALPNADSQRLNRALVQLARRPRNLSALIEAGDAAMAINDLDAALGFFGRARELEPSNPRVGLGLAAVFLRSGRPVQALPLIEQAQRSGAANRRALETQALALDMIGDQRGAQTIYLQLLQETPGNEVLIRRLAINHAILGERAQFEQALRPLIDRRDFAAFRARAFGLAILGEKVRATAIVDAVMPRGLASRIAPYLEFMPRLTTAQQAAAANLGIFPRAVDIGSDSPAIIAYADRYDAPERPERAPPSPTQAPGDTRLEPSGTPLGEQTVRIVEVNRDATQEPLGAPAPPKSRRTNLEEAFADLDADAKEDRTTGSPAQAAVDLRTIAIPIESEQEKAPAAPVHPRRIWVQVATGRDLEALGFDWRRLARKAPDLLGDLQPHTAVWGEANRLLAGPVASDEAAREMINALKVKGIDTFAYTSPEGTAIAPLD